MQREKTRKSSKTKKTRSELRNIASHALYMERPYQKLLAWREAYSLCLLIYKFTKAFPADERFGLISQMRRASSSVPINITEGNSKYSVKEKSRYFEIAIGSLNELHCECLLAKDLSYLSPLDFEQADDAIQRVSFLLINLRKAIRC